MGPDVDCELIRGGLLGQPVNALTALSFVVVGMALLSRERLRWVSLSLIGTGVGSSLFHGPMLTGAEWAHDVTLAWLILVIVGLGQMWERWTRLPGLVVLGTLFALAPVIADPIAVVMAAGGLILLLARDRSIATIPPLALLAVSAIIGRLGATGGPLCEPGSILQPHGLWHVASAVAVGWWAIGADHRLVSGKSADASRRDLA